MANSNSRFDGHIFRTDHPSLQQTALGVHPSMLPHQIAAQAQSCEQRRKPELEAGIDRLTGDIANLHTLVQTLHSRLTCLMRPCPPAPLEPDAGEHPPAVTTVGEALQDQAKSVRLASLQLQDMLERLEV